MQIKMYLAALQFLYPLRSNSASYLNFALIWLRARVEDQADGVLRSGISGIHFASAYLDGVQFYEFFYRLNSQHMVLVSSVSFLSLPLPLQHFSALQGRRFVAIPSCITFSSAGFWLCRSEPRFKWQGQLPGTKLMPCRSNPQ